MPHAARPVVLSALLLLAAGACSGKQYLYLTIDSDTALTFAALDVTVENAGHVGTAHFDHGATIPPATTATVHFDEPRDGLATVTLIALDATGMELARGSEITTLTRSERTDVTIHLGKKAAVDGGSADAAIEDMHKPPIDGGAGDLWTPDLSVAPDLTAVLGFAPFVSYQVGADAPDRVWLVDADRDGLVDVLTEVTLGQKVQLATLRAINGGGFRAPIFFNCGIVGTVDLFDVTSDGTPDLFCFDLQSPTFSVYRAKGDGTYSGFSNVAVGAVVRGQAFYDFNGDGNIDLLTLIGGPSRLRFFPGSNNTTFGVAADSPFSGVPSKLRIGDVNGDGVADVVGRDDEGARFYTALGNGRGAFGNPSSTNVGNTGGTLLLADFDRDGRLDVVTGPSGNDRIVFFKGRGDGTFGVPIASNALTALEYQSADMDLDGIPDLVGYNTKLQNVVVWLGRGDGTFGQFLSLPGPAQMFAVAVGDLDADGDRDIVVGDFMSKSIGVFINTLR